MELFIKNQLVFTNFSLLWPSGEELMNMERERTATVQAKRYW